uniref:Uncharacterized protein n=1 Tax=Plectus sambesii TaxID=2011161 RepID=A0A914X3V0_9BILA
MRGLSIILSLSLVVKISSQGCPDGWRLSYVVPNKCYHVGVHRRIWFEAESFCKNAQPSGHLISISSAFENGNVGAVVISTASVLGCDRFWIGGNDLDQSGVYAWVDGRPWVYAKWDSGQPDLAQQCAESQARTTGLWGTEPCENENCFICEMYTVPPTDCKDWFSHGSRTDGIYSINPDGWGSFDVFCDMTTDGGGWTVFQRRIDDSLSFYNKSWNDYKVGFNNGLEKNLWLGNDNIHILTTKNSNVELRIDLWGNQNPFSSDPNEYLWEKRANFFIDDEAHFYTLHLSTSYTGNATTSPGYGISYSNGLPFSTVDAINGASSNCFSTESQLGGWWFNIACASAALNGKYVPPSWNGNGFSWYTGAARINPKQSRMMLRSL